MPIAANPASVSVAVRLATSAVLRRFAGLYFAVSEMNAGTVPGGSTRNRIEMKAVAPKSSMAVL